MRKVGGLKGCAIVGTFNNSTGAQSGSAARYPEVRISVIAAINGYPRPENDRGYFDSCLISPIVLKR
jgi:hypothetical protein